MNYRTAGMVCDCLESLAVERRDVSFEALVVDNDSRDGSSDRIREAIEARGWTPWARVIESPVNGGFSAGNNVGLRASRGRMCLLLNSDAIVLPGAIRQLLLAAAENPRAGVIGSRLEWPNGKAQVSAFRSLRPSTELVKTARTKLVTRLFQKSEPALGVLQKPTEVPWLSFAAVLIRRDVIRSVGYLDEGYFMYYEDVDYCRRAADAGWAVLYWPQSRVVHLRGGTSPVKSLERVRARRPEYFYASRARYYAKFYGRSGLWRANIYWILGRGISMIFEIVNQRSARSCDFEWKDIWTHAGDPLRSSSKLISR